MLSKNIGTKGISILLAFMLWLFVFNQDGGSPPEYTRTIPGIPVKVVGARSDNHYTLYPSEADVVVAGSQQFVGTHETLQPDLTVDVSNLSPGIHNIEVNASISGGNIQSLSPNWVTVKVDEIITHQKEIVLELEGQLPQGELENVQLDPETVTLKGPRNEIERIVEVSALIDLTEIEDSQQIDIPLALTNTYGESIDSVSLSPSDTTATVSVEAPKQETEQELIVLNVSEGLEAELSPSQITLYLDDDIDADDLEAYVDLEDLSPGQHQVAVELRGSNDINVDEVEFEPQQINVNLIERE